VTQIFRGRGESPKSIDIRGLRVDREQLRRIVAEELARALAEAGATGLAAGGEAGRAARGAGLIVFSGPRAPGERIGKALSELASAGWRLEGLTSLTFRAITMGEAASALRGIVLMGDADDESATAARVESASWLMFPDLSDNALAKAVQGIADSLPTRALAQALGSGKACLLVETREAVSAVTGLDRLEKMRRLERRGATLADAAACVEALNRALAVSQGWGFAGAAGGRQLITADDVREAARRGMTQLSISAAAIVTERARDDARALGIEIVRGGGGV
jgi:hypothetical protein